ncbi:tail fiber protein [Leeuwenhoekiella aequorea]|uniref:phage tail protein n=1 Tax=Leeuwenhoekiella aequorea TaxID=283736 RepID=UPI00352E7DE0|tara:strand:- start:351 stop:932 length:582 start_codon:yes stop_codon:yes gene_type:complete
MKKYYQVLILFLLISSFVQAQDAYIGEVRLFAGNFAPRGWAFCDGLILPIAQNTALFSILGTTYGGDGRTTFALPDLRGRGAVHPGTGPGLNEVKLGQMQGAETNILVANQLPVHNHPVYGIAETGNVDSPAGSYPANTMRLDPEYAQAGTLVQMNSGMVGVNQPNSQPVENRQPSLALRYIIALQGIYPSRN